MAADEATGGARSRGSWRSIERAAVQDVAPLAALLFGLHYGALSFVHTTQEPREAWQAIAAFAGGSALVYGGLAFFWRFVRRPDRSSRVIITLAGIALLNNTHLFWRLPLPEHADAHLLVLMGVAMLDVTWPAFWGFLVAALAAFSIGPLRSEPGTDWGQAMILMGGTTMIALAVRSYRTRSRTLLEEAREESEHQRRAAEASVVALRQETAERERLQDELARSERHRSLAMLAGGVAHDVNNLMTVVVGNAALALDEPGSQNIGTELRAILEAGDRATLLSRSLLAYAGGESRSPVLVDLGAEAETIANLATSSLPRGVSLEVHRTKEVLSVFADRAQLQQVMSNLIQNAADASAEQGGHIHVEIQRRSLDAGSASRLEPAEPRPPGLYACVEVRDRGIGMDDDVKRRIFDPFFTTKPEGSGLGLAAVLGIARSSGGGIRVSSEPGRGSIFSFWLPEAAGAPAASPRQGAGEPELPRGTILVVDDMADVRATLSRGLRSHGLDVREAESGQAAVACLRRRRGEVRAAVVDMSMPGMDGEETLHALRELDPALPVVLTSGFDVHAAATRLTTLPAVDFLAKPYRTAELLTRIEAVSRERPEHERAGRNDAPIRNRPTSPPLSPTGAPRAASDPTAP